MCIIFKNNNVNVLAKKIIYYKETSIQKSCFEYENNSLMHF